LGSKWKLMIELGKRKIDCHFFCYLWDIYME